MLADFKQKDAGLSDGSTSPVRRISPDAGVPWCGKSADAAHAVVESEHGRGKVESLSSLVANRLPSRRF